MTNDEVKTLMRAIKNTYPKFSVSEGIVEEWNKRLSHYDFKEVEQNFNNYVLSGNTQTISIVDLISGLYTKEQKEPIKGYFYCIRCKKRFDTIEDADKCYERDMDISYIKRISEKMGIRYNDFFGNLFNATLDEINKNYDDFILRVIEKQKENPILEGRELDGLRLYYKNVLKDKEI